MEFPEDFSPGDHQEPGCCHTHTGIWVKLRLCLWICRVPEIWGKSELSIRPRCFEWVINFQLLILNYLRNLQTRICLSFCLTHTGVHSGYQYVILQCLLVTQFFFHFESRTRSHRCSCLHFRSWLQRWRHPNYKYLCKHPGDLVWQEKLFEPKWELIWSLRSWVKRVWCQDLQPCLGKNHQVTEWMLVTWNQNLPQNT